jgi:tellurite resistance protein TerC
VYKALKKIMPISNHIDSEHCKRRHITAATPFCSLIVIEVMDVVFAVDSVPAILAITNDPLFSLVQIFSLS